MSDDLRKQIHQSKPAHGARGSGAVDPSRPNTVIYAVYLASGAIALVAVGAMVRLAVNLATSPARALPTYPLAVVIVSLMAVGLWGLEAFLIYGTWLGRNRSRILYIGLTLVAIIGTLMNTGVIEGLAKQPLGAGQFILTTCLELVAVTLLVLPVSNAWFREMRARKPVANVMKPERPVESLSSGIPLADSQRRWVPLALSVVVILLLSWPVYSSGVGVNFMQSL